MCMPFALGQLKAKGKHWEWQSQVYIAKMLQLETECALPAVLSHCKGLG